MPPRDLGIGDRDVGVLPADQLLRLDVEPRFRERSGLGYERGDVVPLPAVTLPRTPDAVAPPRIRGGKELIVDISISAREVFLDTCRRKPAPRVPVWFMRQAGRSLPEYRDLRSRHSILDLCRTPELTVEATLQPVRRLGVDAAILFSDIVVPLAPMGIDLDIVEGVGPVVADPVRTAADADRLRRLERADLDFVAEAVGMLVEELTVPLIGFAGAPFTLASYLVEGGSSKNHARTKAMMLSDRSAWTALMEKLSASVVTHLRAQIEAGAAAVQLFDSWVGALTPEDFRRYVKPHVESIFTALDDLDAPRIYFGIMTSELLADMAATGAEVIGADWRVPLDEARRRTGDGVALQGNLDPAACLAPGDALDERVRDVLARGGGLGHVFNLGHGVLPKTDPAVLAHVVDLVHEWDPR